MISNPIAIIYCHLRLHHNISFSDYKLFAEWLDAYQYTLPADRKVSCDLGMALASHYAGKLTIAWHRYNDCEHFNTLIQEEITQWILDYDRCHTHRYSQRIPALESTNSTD